jgi:anthranilate/para-aminobenzoate synthase component I
VAAFAYELGQYIHKLEQRKNANAVQHPLIQAWSYKSYESLSKDQVDAFIKNGIRVLEPDTQIAGVANLQFSVDKEQFTSDIKTIQEYIRNGDTYQINHTFRITGLGHSLRKTLISSYRNPPNYLSSVKAIL